MSGPGKRVGLALGSGAARGTAHLGVLRALRDLDIPVDCIAGTSIGSLVGGVYASGETDRLEEALLNLDWKEILTQFLDLSIPRKGLIDGKRIVEFVSDFVTPTDIRELPVPFRAVATDILSGREMVLSEGPLIEGIRASISVPGIFTPVPRGGYVLVDGGLVNPVPVSVVRDMGAEFVIAVDINAGRIGGPPDREVEPAPGAGPPGIPEGADREEASAWRQRVSEALRIRYGQLDRSFKVQVNRIWRPDGGPNVVDILGNSIRIMEAQISESMLKISRPDLIIRPEVSTISFLEFNRTREGIDAGYAAAFPLLEAARNRIMGS